MNPGDIVKTLARDAGFDLAGITSADPLVEEEIRLRSWLTQGHHGEMAYMARDPSRRARPRESLPEAESVLALALHYNPRPSGETPGTGRISRYAWGRDYHAVVETRLKKLLTLLNRAFPGVRTRCYVDHGPVLEKALAQRAGLGFIGKHTNLITAQYGSWVFLAEVFMDLTLEPDTPQTENCAGCTLCMDACPTGALEPYALDARRCISYLTIELRADIPQELRNAMGAWIFGCDICQEVCPLNPPSLITAEEAFQPEQGMGPRLSAEDVEALLVPGRFRSRFGPTALARPGRRALLRNLAVALGNDTPRDHKDLLARLSAYPDALVQEHAQWTLNADG